MQRRALPGRVLACAAALWCSCATEPQVTAVEVWPESVSLVRFDTIQLSVAVRDEVGAVIPDAAVTFQSSAPSIVAVSTSGVVRSLGALGQATITVTGEGLVKTVPVTVLGVPARITVTPQDTAALLSGSYQLSVTVFDAFDDVVPAPTVTYESTNEAVATVSGTGLISTVGGGRVAILVRAAGAVTAATLRVDDPNAPAFIEVEPQDTTINQGGTYQLRVRVVSVGGQDLPNAPVTYQSSNEPLVAVSPTGVVSSVGGTGGATITVRSDTARATATVQVADSSIVARLPLSGTPFGAAINGSGVVYVGRLAGSVSRIDMPTIAFSTTFSVGAFPTAIAFDPAGTTAYVTNQLSQNVGVINVASDTQTTTIPFGGDPFVVRVSPDGQVIWVTTNANRIFGIDAVSRGVVHDIALSALSNAFAFHPTYDSIMYASLIGGTVEEIDVSGDSILRTFTVGGVLQGIVVSPSGDELYVADESNNSLKVVSLTSGGIIATVPLAAGPFDVQLSPDGTSVWVGEPGRVQVVNRTSRAITRTIVTGGYPRRMVFHAATATLIVANEHGWVDFIR